MLGGRTTSTPLDPNLKIENADSPVIEIGKYQRLVGRLIYLSHTKPDIAFVVSLVSQFMHNPIKEYMQAVRRILCYLKTTPGKGLLFRSGKELEVPGYTNADYGGSLVNKRSTKGYCVFLGSNLASWRSKK